MKRPVNIQGRPLAILTGWLVIWAGLALPARAQQGMTKAQYMDYLTRSGRIEYPAGPIIAGKTLGPADLKLSVLDIGNVRARIRNTGTLGYDRDLLCYEFPFNSGITYRWTLGPMIAGRIDGQKYVSGAALGAVRGTTEDEFRPLYGFDSGDYRSELNIGIAFSDKPASWPSAWPTIDEALANNGQHVLNPAARNAFLANATFDPVATGTARIGSKGFPGVADGEIRAPREAYFVITDNDPAQPAAPLPMNVRVDVWAMQWDDFINRNFIIYKMVFTNIGDKTIENVYVGIHDDPDAPEQGSNEWTDDYAYLVPPGKDTDGDGVPDPDADPRADVDGDGMYTGEDSLLWNTVYLWDGDDQAAGFVASDVGWVGLKFLETPNNPATGEPRGVTTLDIFQYSAAPNSDVTGYDQMAGALHTGLPSTDPQQGGGTPLQRPDWPDGAPDDAFQIENSYGPDVTITAASGPYTMAPGESLPFTFASVHGTSRSDILNNAKLTQILYNAQYRAASGPPIPKVVAVPGNGSVTLYWDDAAELGFYPDGTYGDPLTGNNAFEGYKIFRSDDGGETWGKPIVDLFGAVQGYIPLAVFDLNNRFSGESDTRRHFNLGTNSGLRHTYTDNNVSNGQEYLYAVVAFDSQDGPVPPLETPINAANPDAPDDNTVRAVPMARPAGEAAGRVYNAVDQRDVAIHTAGTSDVSEIPVTLIDVDALVAGTYEVSFDYDEGELVYRVERGGEVVDDMSGRPVEGIPLFDADTDFAPIFAGMRLTVENVPFGLKNSWQVSGTGLTAQSSYYMGWDFGEGMPSNQVMDYELRFVASDLTYTEYYDGVAVTAPYQAWNVTTGEQITAEIIDSDGSGTWNGTEWIIFVNTGYTGSGEWEGAYPDDYALYVRFTSGSTYAAGDIYRFETNKALTDADRYEFMVAAPEYSEELLADDLELITVVPNPFVVSSQYERGRFGVQRILQFHQLPEQCTVRIYTTAGELVQKLEHDGGSIEPWNLQSYNGQEVGFGVYLYMVQTPDGAEHTGKFAVIK
jgi:hypothetical protein